MQGSTQTERETLVCPHCGSDRLATRERAEIWQPATFWREHESDETEVEWDAYDSDDVGDTETIGYACKSCASTFESSEEFITPEEWAADHYPHDG